MLRFRCAKSFSQIGTSKQQRKMSTCKLQVRDLLVLRGPEKSRTHSFLQLIFGHCSHAPDLKCLHLPIVTWAHNHRTGPTRTGTCSTCDGGRCRSEPAETVHRRRRRLTYTRCSHSERGLWSEMGNGRAEHIDQ